MAELKRIYLDAGHGGSDPGAVGYVRESEKAIKMVNFTYDILIANYQCKVYKDITADSITTICNRANDWNADLFMSFHFNAFLPEKGDGWEGLVYSKANVDMGELLEKYVKAVGQNSRGVKIRSDLGVLRLTDMKAILSEIAFVDTWKDIKDWDEDKELKKMAEAHAKFIADYLNLPKKKTTTVKTTKYKTLGNMNHRKKPNLNKDTAIIQQIPEGTTINVQSVDKNGWGKVKYKSKTGYVRIKSATKTYCKKV